MKQKLIELSEILKQKPEIKERLEMLTFGCMVEYEDGYRYTILEHNNKLSTHLNYALWRKDNWYLGALQNYFLYSNFGVIILKSIIGHTPQFNDVLEYLGKDYALTYDSIITNYNGFIKGIISLSPGPLSDQSDETLTQIISLCKNHAQ